MRWFPLDDLPALDAGDAEILAYGRARVRAKAAYAPIALHLLPETFTLGELQTVYEAVLERPLDTRNFRRDVLAAGVVEPPGPHPRGRARAGPPRLYRAAGGDFQVLARERRIARAIAEHRRGVTSARQGMRDRRSRPRGSLPAPRRSERTPMAAHDGRSSPRTSRPRGPSAPRARCLSPRWCGSAWASPSRTPGDELEDHMPVFWILLACRGSSSWSAARPTTSSRERRRKRALGERRAGRRPRRAAGRGGRLARRARVGRGRVSRAGRRTWPPAAVAARPTGELATAGTGARRGRSPTRALGRGGRRRPAT